MNLLTGLGMAGQVFKVYNFVVAAYGVIVDAERAYQDKEITKEERNAVLAKINEKKEALALKNIPDDLVQKLVDVLVALFNGAGVFLKK